MWTGTFRENCLCLTLVFHVTSLSPGIHLLLLIWLVCLVHLRNKYYIICILSCWKPRPSNNTPPKFMCRHRERIFLLMCRLLQSAIFTTGFTVTSKLSVFLFHTQTSPFWRMTAQVVRRNVIGIIFRNSRNYFHLHCKQNLKNILCNMISFGMNNNELIWNHEFIHLFLKLLMQLMDLALIFIVVPSRLVYS